MEPFSVYYRRLVKLGPRLSSPQHDPAALELMSMPPLRMADKHLTGIEKQAQRLADRLNGEVVVDVYAFTGHEAGAVINVHINGIGVYTFHCNNDDLRRKRSGSFVLALFTCATQFHAAVDYLVRGLAQLPKGPPTGPGLTRAGGTGQPTLAAGELSQAV